MPEPGRPGEQATAVRGVLPGGATRGCDLVRAGTSPVNRGSIEFHRRMGFVPEPGDAEVDGVPVASGYDGRGGDRVRFVRSLRGA